MTRALRALRALSAMAAIAVLPLVSACTRTELRIEAARCSLSLPKTWSALKIPAPFFLTEDAYGLLWPGWAAVVEDMGEDYVVGDYPVSVSVYGGSIRASGDSYGWGSDGAGWWIGGRERSEALFSEGEGFDILKGESVVGIRAREDGDSLASTLATAFFAVVDGRAGKILVFVADPSFTDEEAFAAIVGGVVFK